MLKLDKELQNLSLKTSELQALLITHAHSDHVKGLKTFLKKYQVPIYLKEDTYRILNKKIGLSVDVHNVQFIKKDIINIGSLQVHSFRLPHQGWLASGQDDPGAHIGFKFIYKDKALGYFTDLGKMPEDVFPHINDCDYYLLEANHDVLWQKMSKRPPGVIERNICQFGHLSNQQAGEILSRVLVPDKTKRRTKGVMLAHLSRDCNNPILAEDTILKTFTAQAIDPVEIKFAPQSRPSEIIKIF
ncbi:MAG: MBL fold metallo-hydrolase [Candidatus Margulisbacteria bacterium]|nr:MBL fold metallo-hydrolase [Candidatus Margulisiibacteriota bacterium]